MHSPNCRGVNRPNDSNHNPKTKAGQQKNACPFFVLLLTQLTVYEFFRQLAMLGGFLCRKHDGEPGWQTIWRGYQTLHQTMIGIQLAKRIP
ncbi:MAG: IS4 family transposase [Pirellula sp.]